MQTFTKSIFLVSISVFGSSAVLADTISIRADNWFPMNGQPNAKQPGYMIELATHIFTAAGHTVDYKLLPWERAVESVRKGEFDCVVGAYKDDAPDFVYPQAPWGMDRTVFFVKAGDSWTYTGLASFQGKKVAVIKGYAYGDEFDKYIIDNSSCRISQCNGGKTEKYGRQWHSCGGIFGRIDGNVHCLQSCESDFCWLHQVN
jgi:polar amino acid transport system substrate-binding protein